MDDPELWAGILMLNIAEDIARFMHEQQMSKAYLADAAGVKEAVITRVMRGDPKISILTIAKIATALGQTPRDLKWEILTERKMKLL